MSESPQTIFSTERIPHSANSAVMVSKMRFHRWRTEKGRACRIEVPNRRM
ncbi:hypothetical protein CLOSTMETH_01087 [[Clostridium] methylpentosum DSM 5476]|uniref:Uncharacterized protein n=1 Tax=[Clostridium] methylpentosum DSM 5476 TaxID=537013 RepID=C0EB70_9FIRM|nr:hypothetical protein CLOSTMETH_01087 [[Clostridium] methylpentosum DSM 5476]